MAQRDFEKFKQEIKSWIEAHPDKYDAFVEEVNGKSFEGIHAGDASGSATDGEGTAAGSR